MTVPEKTFVEPAAVVPTCRSYCVTPDPAVQVKVALEPVRVLPGAGDVRVAGVAPATPVPLNTMLCGELVAPSVMVTAAVNAPVVAGAKYPSIVQLAPAAKLLPQLFANTNEDAFAPVTAMLGIGKAAVPLFVIVTDCDPVAAPRFSLPKDKLVADSVGGGTGFAANCTVTKAVE